MCGCNTAQDPVADRADAGDHLSFQLGEAARESLEFRAELRAGALDTPFRAGDAPKRKPESSRRRKIKWQRFSKRVKSKYDVGTEPPLRPPKSPWKRPEFFRWANLAVARFEPGEV